MRSQLLPSWSLCPQSAWNRHKKMAGHGPPSQRTWLGKPKPFPRQGKLFFGLLRCGLANGKIKLRTGEQGPSQIRLVPNAEGTQHSCNDAPIWTITITILTAIANVDFRLHEDAEPCLFKRNHPQNAKSARARRGASWPYHPPVFADGVGTSPG